MIPSAGCYEGYRDERLALALGVHTFAGRQRHMYRLITGQTEKLEMHTKSAVGLEGKICRYFLVEEEFE